MRQNIIIIVIIFILSEVVKKPGVKNKVQKVENKLVVINVIITYTLRCKEPKS